MQKITSSIVICGCLYLVVGINLAVAKKETFYSCKNGYQFETQQKAARCIKQQRLSFQAPQSCSKRNKMFKLKIDQRGKQDMCVAQIATGLEKEQFKKPQTGDPKTKTATRNKNRKSLPFTPKCAAGFNLQVRKGKDACAKGKPEEVVAPSKRVVL